jgi:trimeric autotransporter adhesin
MRTMVKLSASVMALAAYSALSAAPAQAAECLLDTNNNGVADAGDTDGGAISSNDSQLACGPNARVSGAGSTAVGSNASATNTGSTAVGQNATADNRSIAVGRSSTATGGNSMALGNSSTASNTHSVAVGESAAAASRRGP